jgi:hypothetical protein
MLSETLFLTLQIKISVQLIAIISLIIQKMNCLSILAGIYQQGLVTIQQLKFLQMTPSAHLRQNAVTDKCVNNQPEMPTQKRENATRIFGYIRSMQRKKQKPKWCDPRGSYVWYINARQQPDEVEWLENVAENKE